MPKSLPLLFQSNKTWTSKKVNLVEGTVPEVSRASPQRKTASQ
jgi:hypothetical protein